jgi:hypothetical protein
MLMSSSMLLVASTIGRSLAMAYPLTPTAPALDPATRPIMQEGPWVSDLHSSYELGECQSTVDFDSSPCQGTPLWYVELQMSALGAANPRWEGKLCNACLEGWLAWANEEPERLQVISVHPIVTGS